MKDLEKKAKGLETGIATLRFKQQNEKPQLKEETCNQTEHSKEQLT